MATTLDYDANLVAKLKKRNVRNRRPSKYLAITEPYAEALRAGRIVHVTQDDFPNAKIESVRNSVYQSLRNDHGMTGEFSIRFDTDSDGENVGFYVIPLTV